MKTCFFIGHAEADERILPALRLAIERHITQLGVTGFTVGHCGGFDRLAARAVIDAKRQHPKISLTLLLPYHPAERPVKTPPGFDGTFYPPGMERVPRRYAIVQANRYMADHADCLIAHVWHPASNARNLLEYAQPRIGQGLLTVENIPRPHPLNKLPILKERAGNLRKLCYNSSNLKKRRKRMERFFKLKERGTSVKTELIAGLTTFFSMVYILMVNANMFADPFSNGTNPLGVSYGAIYIATAISAVVGTILAGVLSNLPLAQASGMGLNAFFVYTVCVKIGLSYANALVLILIEGAVFILLTVTGLRKKIFDALPAPVITAIPAGIGLFIAFLGLQNAGIVVGSDSTCVDLASFNLLKQSWGSIMPMVVTLCTFLAIVIMSHKKVGGAVFIGILGGMGLYYLLGLTVDGFYAQLELNFVSPLEAFKEFGTQSFGKVFTEGFDFSAYIEKHGNANLVLTISTTALAFCMVDMFDTLGTLYAACSRAGLTDEKGEPLNMNEGMLSDAIATTVGAICGTSTVTTFSEVNAGVAAGGRTGLTSIFCGIFFFIAMFLSPIAQLIPSCATAAALIYVGLLMMGAVKNVNWDDFKIAVPAFLTVAIMPFTYNISYGIAFGLISYIVISAFCGDLKKIKASSWVIAALFIAMLVLTH